MGGDDIRWGVWRVDKTKRMGWEQRAEKSKEPEREKSSEQSNNSSQGCRVVQENRSIERRLGRVVDGLSSWMDEPDIPRVTTNQTGRVQRLKMLGNAVVPQVVYQLGLAMKELWNEV